MTDHPDIVERLRLGACAMDVNMDWPAMEEAAAEITRLRAEVEALRNALIGLDSTHSPAPSNAPTASPPRLRRRLRLSQANLHARPGRFKA